MVGNRLGDASVEAISELLITCLTLETFESGFNDITDDINKRMHLAPWVAAHPALRSLWYIRQFLSTVRMVWIPRLRVRCHRNTHTHTLALSKITSCVFVLLAIAFSTKKTFTTNLSSWPRLCHPNPAQVRLLFLPSYNANTFLRFETLLCSLYLFLSSRCKDQASASKHLYVS